MITITAPQAEALFKQLLGTDWRERLHSGGARPDAPDHDAASSRHWALRVVHQARPDIDLSRADRRVIAAAWTAVRQQPTFREVRGEGRATAAAQDHRPGRSVTTRRTVE